MAPGARTLSGCRAFYGCHRESGTIGPEYWDFGPWTGTPAKPTVRAGAATANPQVHLQGVWRGSALLDLECLNQRTALAQLSQPEQPQILQFDPDRRRIEDQVLAELLQGIVARIKELELRNRKLIAANGELRSSLQAANERIAKFEQSPYSRQDVAQATLDTTARTLELAQEAMDLLTRSTAETLARHQEVTTRAAEMLKEAAALLEKARRDGVSNGQEAGPPAVDAPREAQDSVLAMAEAPEGPYGRTFSPDTQGEPSATPGQVTSIQSTSRASAESRPSLPTVDRATPATEATVAIPNRDAAIDSVELAVSPVSSFAMMSSFHRAVQQLPGVVEVKAHGFERGRLQLTIRFSRSRPLLGNLMDLSQFSLRLVSAEQDRVELLIGTRGRE